MADREKVIKGLERCLVCDMSFIASEEGQKAYIDCEYTTGLYCRRDKLLHEVLALLKEQEEKRTPKPIIHGYKEEYWGEEEICPDCGKKWQSAIIDTTHFCPGCGRSVKWE